MSAGSPFLSSQAEINRFLAGEGVATVSYLDAQGRTCAAEHALTIRLRRPVQGANGVGLLTIHLDVGAAEPVLRQMRERQTPARPRVPHGASA